MVVFKKCCCCIQLTTGVVVLGSYSLISALIEIVTASVLYSKLDDLWNPRSFEYEVLSYHLPVSITYAVAMVVASIVMIRGAIIRNRFLLLPWLVLAMILIVTVTLGFLCLGMYCMVEAALSGNDKVIFIGIAVFVSGILCFGINLYLWLCILSCFQDIRDNSPHEQNISFKNVKLQMNGPEYKRMEDQKDNLQ